MLLDSAKFTSQLLPLGFVQRHPWECLYRTVSIVLLLGTREASRYPASMLPVFLCLQHTRALLLFTRCSYCETVRSLSEYFHFLSRNCPFGFPTLCRMNEYMSLPISDECEQKSIARYLRHRQLTTDVERAARRADALIRLDFLLQQSSHARSHEMCR